MLLSWTLIKAKVNSISFSFKIYEASHTQILFTDLYTIRVSSLFSDSGHGKLIWPNGARIQFHYLLREVSGHWLILNWLNISWRMVNFNQHCFDKNNAFSCGTATFELIPKEELDVHNPIVSVLIKSLCNH